MSLNGIPVIFKPCLAILYYLFQSFSKFPSPAGMSLIKLSLGGNYDVIYKLFLPKESLVCNISAGDGNIEKLFLRCKVFNILKRSTNSVPVEKIAVHVGKSLAMTLRRLELRLNVVEKLLEKFKDVLYLTLFRMAIGQG